jgi:hypothetical protein
MKQKRFLGIYCFGVVCAAAILGSSTLWAQVNATFNLPNNTNVFVGSSADVDLTVTSDVDLQGVVAAAELDNPNPSASITNIDDSAVTALGADQVVSTVVGGKAFVLGVVMDLDITDNGGIPETIPAGGPTTVATVTLSGDSADTSSNFSFVDGVYSADGAQNGPPQDNIVVNGGMSFDQTEGLTLSGGTVNVLPIPPGTYRVSENNMGAPGQTSVCANVELDSNDGVQGYVVALEHSAEVTLVSAALGADAAAAGAEFVDVDVFAGQGGVVSVILDFEPPYDNQVVGPGLGLVIATYCYDVVNSPDSLAGCDEEPPREGPIVSASLSFADFSLDTPPKENVTVVNGQSLNVAQVNGSVSFKPSPCVECVREHVFACGSELSCAERCAAESGEGGFSLEGAGFALCDPVTPDSTAGAPGNLVGQAGLSLPVCFYYTSPPTGIVDESIPEDVANDNDDIQGVSMSVAYDVGLHCLGTFSLEDSITEAVGADFVNVDCEDNGPNGGGSLIIGVLVDFLPPFEGQTLPPTLDFLKVITVNFALSDTLNCGDQVSMSFQDCTDPNSKPCIKNLISSRNRAIAPRTFGCTVTLIHAADFVRGDCNFDFVPGMEFMAVNIADPAAVISHLFLTGAWKFEPPCLDACDCNDDGRIDLADAVCVLTFLFKNSTGEDLPPPGAMAAGRDPTEDKLDCSGPADCPGAPQ